MTGPSDSQRTLSRRRGPTYAALAEQLRIERNRQGLTQRELAVRFGGSATQVCNWETGYAVPGIAAMANWARALGLELALVPGRQHHPAARTAPFGPWQDSAPSEHS